MGEIAVALVTIAHDAIPEPAVFGIARFTRVDHRQGEFAFAEVVADALADDGSEAAIVQQVIDDLEGAAEAAAIFAHRVGGGVIVRCRVGAGAGGGLEQGGSLGFDDGHVFADRQVNLAERGELADFAFGDDTAGARQDVEDAHVARLGHQRERAGEEEVADEDGGGRAPDIFGGGLATAQV